MKLFKRREKLYPITISDMQNRYDEIWKLFVKKKIHKDGVFIDLFFLQAMWEGEMPVFNFGDKLTVTKGETPDGQLAVLNEKGEFLGLIPSESSIFPNRLLDFNIKLWCFVEAVDTSEFFPAVALSLYCENY